MATMKTTPQSVTPAVVNYTGRKFVLSFQAERFYKGVRYHWMVCLENDPTQLISWGHAPSQQLAESAGQVEISDLLSGISTGGQVVSNIKAFSRRR
jgi:hypothetical protein